MNSELLREVLRGRRMPGEIGERGAALLKPCIRIEFSEHRLVARLMQALGEGKLATMVRFDWRDPGPASDDVGVAGDVLLRVAGVNAERMQFHRLTGEVLVEAF